MLIIWLAYLFQRIDLAICMPAYFEYLAVGTVSDLFQDEKVREFRATAVALVR